MRSFAARDPFTIQAFLPGDRFFAEAREPRDFAADFRRADFTGPDRRFEREPRRVDVPP
jgi:hypothetical protein